jgi:hypothetical protein
MTDIATPADRLKAYRSRHLIDLRATDEAHIYRCAVDGIQVHGTRDGRWRHDHSEIVALLEAEYGGPWGGPKEAVGFPR